MSYEYYECFCCEKNFTQEQALEAGVTPEWAVEYCSPECQTQFTDLCRARALVAQATGLIDEHGEPLRTQPQSQVLNLLSKYNIKVTP